MVDDPGCVNTIPCRDNRYCNLLYFLICVGYYNHIGVGFEVAYLIREEGSKVMSVK